VLAACYFGISLRRGLYELLGPPPLPMHDALELALGMKDVEPHLDRPGCRTLLGLVRTRLVGELHTPLNPLARIRHHALYEGPLGHESAPALPRAVRTTLTRHPRQTMWLHRHQDRLTMEENFIQT
jgi:hypothetical protein